MIHRITVLYWAFCFVFVIKSQLFIVSFSGLLQKEHIHNETHTFGLVIDNQFHWCDEECMTDACPHVPAILAPCRGRVSSQQETLSLGLSSRSGPLGLWSTVRTSWLYLHESEMWMEKCVQHRWRLFHFLIKPLLLTPLPPYKWIALRLIGA